MNKNSNYIRKVIYIALIGILLVPLSFLSRPTTRDADNEIQDMGGKISELRNKHELSQAKLSEIDAGSEALRFSLLGMRGIASTSLWLQAIEAKKKEDWNSLEATLNTLIKIQPNFIRVWEYQAHNMSYNVSVEFDDYQFRYAWVKKGINFLTEGIPYNRRDHRISDNLGFFTGQKIGRSDERVQFRQMFRGDDDFHKQMQEFPFIHKDIQGDRIGFDSGDFGPDNWLLAHQWYRRSEDMVNSTVDGTKPQKYRYDFLFYMWAPAQLRNHVMSLQDEEKPVASFQSKWNLALEKWQDFGNRPMETTFGLRLSLEGMQASELEINELRRELDKLVPNVRRELEKAVYDQVELTDEEKMLLDRDVDTLNDYEQRVYREAKQKVFLMNQNIDFQVAKAADPNASLEADRILEKIKILIARQMNIDKYSDTTNYIYWKNRALGESTATALDARVAAYEAEQKGDMSRLEPFVDIDPISSRPRKDSEGNLVVVPGAIQEYETSFKKWGELMEEYQVLKKGALAEDLMEEMESYQDMIKASNRQWPLDFPMQQIIDRKAATSGAGILPTSEDLAGRREREEQKKDELQNSEKSNDEKPKDQKQDDKKQNDGK